MLGPTWLTDRLAFAQSQLLSGPSFSHVNAWSLGANPTTASFFMRLNCPLFGSHLLLHAVAKTWRKRSATMAMSIAAKIQLRRPIVRVFIQLPRHEGMRCSAFSSWASPWALPSPLRRGRSSFYVL